MLTFTVKPSGYSNRGQLFDGFVDGRLIVARSTQPLLDGCRVGRSQLRPDHFATMLNLINDKRGELAKVEMELRQWLARQPQDPP
jgi:hypothetical protein